jgi:hypothetical protein
MDAHVTPQGTYNDAHEYPSCDALVSTWIKVYHFGTQLITQIYKMWIMI